MPTPLPVHPAPIRSQAAAQISGGESWTTKFTRFSRAQKAIAQSTDKGALRKVLQQVAGGDGRVAAAPTAPLLLSAAGLLVGGFALAALGTGVVAIAAWVGAAVTVLAAFVVRRQRQSFLRNFAAHCGQLDYGLKTVKVKGQQLWRDWKKDFRDLQRGDDGQTIDRVVRGQWRHDGDAGAGHEITCFRFVYQTTEESTSTDSDDHSTTTTTTTKHHRYGVIARTPQPLQIGCSEQRRPGLSAKWTTASIEFNRRFKLAASSEQVAAHFFKPSAVQALWAFAGSFEAVDIHAVDDRLYIGFDNDDLLQVNQGRDPGDSLQALEALLDKRCAMHQFNALLHLLRQTACKPGSPKEAT